MATRIRHGKVRRVMMRGGNTKLSRYVQHRIERWQAEGKSMIDLAARAGVSRSLVSQVRASGVGVGWSSAERFADAFGMTMPELVAAADTWANESAPPAPAPPPPPVSTIPEDIYPERAVAAAAARLDGISEDAIQGVLSMVRRASPDAPRLTWRDWHARMITLAQDLEEQRELGVEPEPGFIAEPKRGRKKT